MNFKSRHANSFVSFGGYTIILLSMLCFGCQTKHLSIPYVYPKITLPDNPVDYTKMLSSVSTPDEVMKAWVGTAVGYKEWNVIVREQINKQ